MALDTVERRFAAINVGGTFGLAWPSGALGPNARASILGLYHSPLKELSGGATLADVEASGGFLGEYGTITISDFMNGAGMPVTSVAVPFVAVFPIDSATQLCGFTDHPIDSGGEMVIDHASLEVGEEYIVVGWEADGSARFWVRATAT